MFLFFFISFLGFEDPNKHAGPIIMIEDWVREQIGFKSRYLQLSDWRNGGAAAAENSRRLGRREDENSTDESSN